MALPPEPIVEMLPKASACVLAKVTRVIHKDPAPAPRDPPPPEGSADVPGDDAPRQVVEREVADALFGAHPKGARIEVEKPAGDYALAAGHHGPFLLQAGAPGAPPRILGRYGPDTWTADRIRAAAKDAGLA